MHPATKQIVLRYKEYISGDKWNWANFASLQLHAGWTVSADRAVLTEFTLHVCQSICTAGKTDCITEGSILYICNSTSLLLEPIEIFPAEQATIPTFQSFQTQLSQHIWYHTPHPPSSPNPSDGD